jgi:aconitate hydratase
MGIDFKTEPLGNNVFLADVFPTEKEIADAVEQSGALSPETYKKCYENVFQSNETWNSIPTQPSKLFAWNESSTYIQEPPFLS